MTNNIEGKNEQYFNAEPTSKHHFQKINYEIENHKFIFTSDSGVFSRSRIDFGTDVLLKTFFKTESSKQNKKILDLGTGYGVVGTVVNKILNIEVDMVDVNKRAIELAKQNLANNNASGNVFESNIYENIKNKYDAILVNPPIRAGKDVVTEMLKKSIQFLKPKGEIFVVIQKKQGAPSAQRNLEETFKNVEILNRDKGYYILRSINE